MQNSFRVKNLIFGMENFFSWDFQTFLGMVKHIGGQQNIFEVAKYFWGGKNLQVQQNIFSG